MNQKNIFFFTLFTLFAGYAPATLAMDSNQSRRDWNGGDYQKGNCVQTQAAQEFLQEAGIDFLLGKVVCDMGCGTGENTIKMAQTAIRVFGFDASESMINTAKPTYADVQNVQFALLSAEQLNLIDMFDSLTCFFCLHWIQDKQTVFTNFYNALKPGGRMLCTIAIKEDSAIEAVGEFLQHLQIKYPVLQNKTLQELTGRFSITSSDLKIMLAECGFESVVIESKIMRPIFENQEKFAQWQKPIFMGAHYASFIPEDEIENLFTVYIDGLWAKLKKDANGNAVFPIATTLVSAQKPL